MSRSKVFFYLLLWKKARKKKGRCGRVSGARCPSFLFAWVHSIFMIRPDVTIISFYLWCLFVHVEGGGRGDWVEFHKRRAILACVAEVSFSPVVLEMGAAAWPEMWKTVRARLPGTPSRDSGERGPGVPECAVCLGCEFLFGKTGAFALSPRFGPSGPGRSPGGECRFGQQNVNEFDPLS